MKKVMMIAFGIIMAGCVSVESTRELLNSKDSTAVSQAEERVYNIGVQGKDPCGINSTWFVPVETSQQVEYVKLLSNPSVLAFLYPVFVFLIGGTALCSICLAIGMGETVAGLLGVAAGVVAVVYRKHITIPITSYSGASMLVIGLAFLFAGMFQVVMHIAVVYILLVLFLASGIFVQYKYTAKDAVVPAKNPGDAK